MISDGLLVLVGEPIWSAGGTSSTSGERMFNGVCAAYADVCRCTSIFVVRSNCKVKGNKARGEAGTTRNAISHLIIQDVAHG